MTPKLVSIELSGKMKRARIPISHTLMAQNQLDMPDATKDKAYSIQVSQKQMFYTNFVCAKEAEVHVVDVSTLLIRVNDLQCL